MGQIISSYEFDLPQGVDLWLFLWGRLVSFQTMTC